LWTQCTSETRLHTVFDSLVHCTECQKLRHTVYLPDEEAIMGVVYVFIWLFTSFDCVRTVAANIPTTSSTLSNFLTDNITVGLNVYSTNKQHETMQDVSDTAQVLLIAIGKSIANV